MWNDTDIPLAILITFRCYGTWLHGDERDSIDRHNNAYGTPRIKQIEHWNQITHDRLKHEPVHLDARRRASVETAIGETCKIRNWGIYAINIRTNHVHVVAAVGGKDPDAVMTAFKANSTRKMREDGCWPFGHSPWAEKGSRRRLWNEKHIAGAVDYVAFGQGGELPEFE